MYKIKKVIQKSEGQTDKLYQKYYLIEYLAFMVC